MADLKALDPFPALQLAVGFVVALAGCYAIYRGIRDGRTPPAPAPDPTLVFLDGPIGECLKGLSRIAAALEHAPILQAELRESVNAIGERVSEAKARLFDRIEAVERQEEAARRDLESRLRAVEQECARLGARSPSRRR